MPNNRQNSSSRRSTRLKSNRLPLRNGVPLFLCSDEDIDRLENIWPEKFTEDMRSQIKHVIDNHFLWSEAAQSAPYVSEVQQKMSEIQDASSKLLSLLSDRTEVVEAEAVQRLEEELYSSNENYQDVVPRLTGILADIVKCCGSHIGNSSNFNGSLDGHQEWEETIVKLTEILRENGFSTGASADPTPSHFVTFIEKIHRVLPESAIKRGTHSPGALVEAVKRARRADRNRRRELVRANRSIGASEIGVLTSTVPKEQKEP